MKLHTCRASTTTGTSDVRKMDDLDSQLELACRKLYRSFVGKHAWASPIRPDSAYDIRDLARGLAKPTHEDWAKLKHLVKYLKGNLDVKVRFVVLPKIKIALGTCLDLEAFSDTDWAGCSKARKSTSGGLS